MTSSIKFDVTKTEDKDKGLINSCYNNNMLIIRIADEMISKKLKKIEPKF